MSYIFRSRPFASDSPRHCGQSGTFDLPGWLAKHGQDVTRPFIDKVIAGLKERGVTQFAATGYCFGGEW